MIHLSKVLASNYDPAIRRITAFIRAFVSSCMGHPWMQNLGRYSVQINNGGVESLLNVSRRKANPKNRVDESTEQAVLRYATDYPARGQARTSNELRKLGVLVSPSGVRNIWLRHNLYCFKLRLRALEEIVARESTILTEADADYGGGLAQ